MSVFGADAIPVVLFRDETDAVSVGTTATLITAASGGRNALVVKNAGSVPVALGFGPGVTFADGLLIAAGDSLTLTAANVAVWGVTESVTCDVRVAVLT